MKRFFTICVAALLAATSFAQVNVWSRSGYLRQFEKATFDSITFSMMNPYTEYESRIARNNAPTGERRDMFDLQKTLYVGLQDLGYTRQNDFGWAAVCMHLETRGQDFIGSNTGFNWFGVWGDPSKWRDNTLQSTAGLVDHIVWFSCYKPILAANFVIATRTGNSEEDQYAVAQAKALRAFEYMQLAQAFQVAYSESSLNLPCVPLVLDTMSAYLIPNEKPATVAQIYAQIKSDLDEACNKLEGYMRPDKSVINQAVAYGLRARYNLLVHKYNQAATDAEQALLLSGATPLSIAEANVPGFADASAHNVLWANIINEEDDIVLTSLVNWQGHLCSFYGDGYASVGTLHWIADELYNQIPATDVRKGWWLNANLESPLLDAPGYSDYKANIQALNTPYQNVKFGTGDGTFHGYGAAAADWIVMRAEELILLRAEALARAGKDGASVLTNFVTTYRDPSYDINAHGLSVADEIWWQRRVELWGEGFAFQDLMRLHKGAIRTASSNWPSAWNQDVPADDERFPLAVPAKQEDYKVLAVWRNGNQDLYNTYYMSPSSVDSITLGEAKEIDDLRISYWTINRRVYAYNTFKQTFKEGEMGELTDTVMLEFARSHNVINPINVPLIIEADPVFAGTAFPQSISLEGGTNYTRNIAYVDTSFVVHLNELPVGTYQFTISIPEEYSQGTLASENRSFTYQIVVEEHNAWDDAEIQQGVWVDETIGPAFGLDVTAWYVQYQKLDYPDGSKQIRVLNPYACYATDWDADGIYDGFVYNESGDVDESQPFNFMLNIAADGEVRFNDIQTRLGLSWGQYTDMTFFDYAQSKGNPGTYGHFDSEKSRIVFDAHDNTMLIILGGKVYSIQVNFRFYLSKDAYLLDQQGEVAEATVETYEGNWTVSAIDVNTGDPADDRNITIVSSTDENGQFYTITNLNQVLPTVYGSFDETTKAFLLSYNNGINVTINEKTYQATLYPFNKSYSLLNNIAMKFVPGETENTVVLAEDSEAIGFAIVYFNVEDNSDYQIGEAIYDLSLAKAAGAPAHKAGKRPAFKAAKQLTHEAVKRPARVLRQQPIQRLSNDTKVLFQTAE